MIAGHGSSSPDAFLIADSASSDDLRTGYAITGYQQSVLAELANLSGINIQNFYKTCLLKDEKSANSWTREDADIGLQVGLQGPILLNEIQELKPFLLIPLGELSFSYLTSLQGIRKFRGSCVLADSQLNLQQPYKVLPILGPYPYLNQEYRMKFISRIDFTKIPKYLNRELPDEKRTNVWIAWTSAALRGFLERSYRADGLLVFDIETYMGLPTCISFCFDGKESVCAPFLDPSVDLDNRVLMIDLIARVLNSPIRKVNQNVKYDWKIMERWGFRVNNVIGDTMLAASSLYCEFPKNLGFLTSIYTDLPYFKDEGKDYDPSIHKKEQFYLYNAKDSLATHQVYSKQVDEVGEQGVGYVYESLVKLIPVYRRMEDRGILVDLDIREELLAKYYGLYEIHCKKLAQLTELTYINPLSSVQMKRLVFEELGYNPNQRGVKGSTREESLELLMVRGEAKRSPTFGKEILQCILDCRKLHKVIEVLELPLFPDNRFRCEFNLAGTETGRSSAGSTTDRIILITEKNKIKVEELGHSLQTIGKHGFAIDGVTYGRDLRRMFIPSPGYRFVEIDLNGAEARVDSILAGNFNLSVFDNPGIHKLTGSWIYDCEPSAINKTDLVMTSSGVYVNRYYVAKQVRHAGERNITADGLVTKLLQGFTVREGQVLLDKFHKKQPEIRETFHRDVITAINATRCLVAPNGRRRDFFDRIDNHTYNEGISQLPQAIVSDQTKFEGILPTAAACPWAYFLSEQHDGILTEVPIGKEKEFAEVYSTNVQKQIDFRKCSLSREYALSIPCEVQVGEDWFNLEDFKL